MEVRYLITTGWLFILSFLAHGQMVHGPDTLTGNEWLLHGPTYYKFGITDDGVYRITYATLSNAGFRMDEAIGSDFRMYSLGKQVPLFVSTQGLFQPDDYIEFVGHRNRGEMDRFLYRLPDRDQLNPDHSMYTDRRPYYLTTSGTDEPLRVTPLINDQNNPPPAENAYLHKETVQYAATHIDPYFTIQGGAVSYSSYMHAEGFAKGHEVHSTTQIAAPNRATTGPDARIRIRFATTNNGNHFYSVLWNNEQIDTLLLTDQSFVDTFFSIPLDRLFDVNELKLNSKFANSRHALVQLELTYSRLKTLAGTPGLRMIIDKNDNKRHWTFSGFQHDGINPVIYTHDGHQRMVAGIVSANEFSFVWPPADNEKELLIVNPDQSVNHIPELTPITFPDWSADDTEYIIITHPGLMAPGTENEYVQYRMSPEGGEYKAKAYSILDIYDQFGYGIEKHPQAIRNFVEFFHRNWPSAQMVFIVGRGIEYWRSRYENGSWESFYFVPTFGRPGSDQLLMATNWNLIPRYAVGRLAITTPEGISTYLSKVKEHDASRFAEQSLTSKSWIKNVMHLGGGKTATEQNDFEIRLKILGDKLAASDYGADIHFFQKSSTDIIGESQSARILELLNEGCGIINYLGHSGSSTFEFQIQDPAEWENRGRYPIVSAMGCSAGQIHNLVYSLSDSYVQLENEGAIAFISGSGSQFAAALTTWANPWYDYFGTEAYGATLGESVLHGLKELDRFINPENDGSNQYRFLVEQQTMQGDPALRFHPLPGPDYTPDRSTVRFSPEVITTDLDSIDIRFSIANLGRNLRENVLYVVQIRSASGELISSVNEQILADHFNSSVEIRMPLNTGKQTGLFRLHIMLDPLNQIDEKPLPAAESNNILVDGFGVEGIEFYVVSNLIRAVFPPDFAIVNDVKPEVVASGSNGFTHDQVVVFEMDTTSLFNSPLKIRERLTGQASSVKWSPDFNWEQDQVYYWRVSADSTSADEGFFWDARSFVYKPESHPGWNQSHFLQFTDATRDLLLVDSLHRTFPFSFKVRNFNILNRYHNVAQGLIPKVTLEGIILAEFFTGFRDRQVNAFVAVIDSVTGEFMVNPNPGLYGSSNHLAFDAKCFAYRTDIPESRQAMIDFIENIIPTGQYVFFYTYQRPAYPDYFPELWAADEDEFGKSIFSMIESQYPGSQIRTLEATGSKPYIVFFQKDRGGIVELIAKDTTEVISYTWDIRSSLTKGTMTTPLVGPASQWYSMHWGSEGPAVDTAGVNQMNAYALSADLMDTMHISANLQALDTLIEDIPADQYPYIQLSFSTQDTVLFDPVDLEYWRVLYEGVPEYVINTTDVFSFHDDTLQQGEIMRIRVGVENLTSYPVDSLPVALRIIDANNEVIELRQFLVPMSGYEMKPVLFERLTDDLDGDYRIVMEINPGRQIPEFDYSNNTGFLQMHIVGDRINPILDVTFDGYHIKNGDLVSSQPLIVASLEDGNLYRRLQDTSAFELYLEYPDEFEPRRLYFSMDWVEFDAAPDAGQNRARAIMTPTLADGLYTLTVFARDASGNKSGDIEYAVSFRVINAESASYIYNYPNPFTNSTRFYYTLTGKGSPDFYKIEILSLDGILVREIGQEELGPLAAGTHPTEFEWHGDSHTGSPLPAGMYLYRMIWRDESGNDYPVYGVPSFGQSVGEGWGKLVLIR